MSIPEVFKPRPEASRAGPWIGSSDMPKLMMQDEFGGTCVDVYYEKTRPDVEEKPAELLQRSHLLRGRLLEDDLADVYRLMHPRRELVPLPVAVHPDTPAARAHPDYGILSPEEWAGPRPLEIKAPGWKVFAKYRAAGLRRREVIQLQFTMGVRGDRVGEFAAGNLDTHDLLISFEQEASPLLVEQMLELADRFVREHIIPHRVPNPDEWRHEPAELPAPVGEVHTIEELEDPAIAEAVRLFFELRAARIDAEAEEEDARAAVEGYMEEREWQRVRLPGSGTIHWTAQQGRRTFRRALLEAAAPLDRDAMLRTLEAVPAAARRSQAYKAIARALESGALDLDVGQFDIRGAALRPFRPFPETR